MRILSLLLIMVIFMGTMPANARPGEPVADVLERYNLQGQKPYAEDDYIAYKVQDLKFISQPTLFLKLGANGIVLEQNFLFDKNTIHERDVQKSKSDTIPTAHIPYQSYLVGDFSQLPRETYEGWDRLIGGIAAPFGAAAGSIIGAGRGAYHGTKIGVGTAKSASKALGGDASGKTSAIVASATGVATGAITGLIGGLTGGVVEGSARGARVGVAGVHGADRRITGEVAVASTHSIIGGRIGKELSIQEQKDLLNKLAGLEQARLANNGINKNNLNREAADTTAAVPSDSNDSSNSYLDSLDTAKAPSDFDSNSDYVAEDGSNKNVAGMW